MGDCSRRHGRRYRAPRCCADERAEGGDRRRPGVVASPSPRLDEPSRGSDAALSSGASGEYRFRARGKASRPTPGWPLRDREVCQGRAGFPTPHRPRRRRSMANIVRRRHEAWSISRDSFLSCDSFLLESRSPGPDAPAGRRWRRLGLSVENRRSTPQLAMHRWSSSGPRRKGPEKIRRSPTGEFLPRKEDGSRRQRRKRIICARS